MKDETRALVSDASQGDLRAVETLLERFLPGLERFVKRRAGAVVSAKESSADLVQSVCREVLDHLAHERLECRGEPEFKQWLYNAALLKIQNRRRFYQAEKRDVAREIPADAQSAGSRAEAFFLSLCTPSQDAARREELARVESAFARLPENYRRIITLAQLEGLSHKEIGEREGVTESHSRVLLSRALARLATVATKRGPMGEGEREKGRRTSSAQES